MADIELEVNEENNSFRYSELNSMDINKKETKNFRGSESKCKVILDGIVTANRSIYNRQVLGHDSFHERTLNKNDDEYRENHRDQLFLLQPRVLIST